jgi:hypothetical protein
VGPTCRFFNTPAAPSPSPSHSFSLLPPPPRSLRQLFLSLVARRRGDPYWRRGDPATAPSLSASFSCVLPACPHTFSPPPVSSSVRIEQANRAGVEQRRARPPRGEAGMARQEAGLVRRTASLGADHPPLASGITGAVDSALASARAPPSTPCRHFPCSPRPLELSVCKAEGSRPAAAARSRPIFLHVDQPMGSWGRRRGARRLSSHGERMSHRSQARPREAVV